MKNLLLGSWNQIFLNAYYRNPIAAPDFCYDLYINGNLAFTDCGKTFKNLTLPTLSFCSKYNNVDRTSIIDGAAIAIINFVFLSGADAAVTDFTGKSCPFFFFGLTT